MSLSKNVDKKVFKLCKYNGDRIRLCGIDSCSFCFNRSLASIDNEKLKRFTDINPNINPLTIFKTVQDCYNILCFVCKHINNMKLCYFTIRNYDCPYCNGCKLCEDLNCSFCNNKSFENHPKSKFYLTELNKILPRFLTKGCNTEFWFKCDVTECSHTFKKSLNMVTRPNKPVWCPYCANQKLCDDTNCIICFNKSLASHPKVQYYLLEKNDNINPRTLFKSSNKKYWFKCDVNSQHIFDVSLDNMTLKNRWCPNCVNKTEEQLYTYLCDNFGDITRQGTFDWCKNPFTNKYLPFDFVLNAYNIIIEVDGRQHFMKVLNWTDLEITRNRDIYKMKLALENGYTIIRIPQEDIQHNLKNWKNKLKNAVKLHDITKIIYLTSEHLYKDFDTSIPYEKILEKFKLESSEKNIVYSDIDKFKRSIYNKDINDEYENTKKEISSLETLNDIKPLQKKKLSNLKNYLNKLEIIINQN
jgi:very-short-patch-repair endonuclease